MEHLQLVNLFSDDFYSRLVFRTKQMEYGNSICDFFGKEKIFGQLTLFPGWGDHSLHYPEDLVRGGKLFQIISGRILAEKDDSSKHIGLYGINSGSTTPGNAVNHDSVFMDSQKIQITIEKGCAKKLMPELGVGGFAHAGVPGKKPCLFSVKYGG